MKLSSILVALLCAALPLAAKPTNWTLPDGKTVSAEATDILGPFAVLGGPAQPGYRVPLGSFSQSEAVRFADALAKLPVSGSDWATSKSVMAMDLAGAMHLQGNKLDDFDRKGVSEPVLYLVIFASAGVEQSWGFVAGTVPKYTELRKRFGEKIEFVLAGIKHRNSEQLKMMNDLKVPYLSLTATQVSNSYTLSLVKPEPPIALLMTRGSTVIGVARDAAGLEGVYRDIEAMLTMNEANDPRSWKDRQKYFAAVQPKLHANDSVGPMLIGDPFDPAKLREVGVEYFEAVVQVKANGEVGTVMLKPGAKMPEKLKADVFAVFKQAVFVGAVTNGTFVDGHYDYTFGKP